MTNKPIEGVLQQMLVQIEEDSINEESVNFCTSKHLRQLKNFRTKEIYD